MKIKTADLIKGLCGVYRITFENGKIYIGLSVDIRRRMYEHNNHKKAKTPCDFAIKKYGRIEEIEILEIVSNPSELSEKEKYWIAKFNSNDRNIGYNLSEGGNNSIFGPRSTFSRDQVLEIRKRKFMGDRKIDVYNESFRNYSFSTFEKCWLGTTYGTVGSEFLIKGKTDNTGLKNGRASFSKDQILSIRQRFDSGETITSIRKDFPNKSFNTISYICKRKTFSDV